MTTAVATTQDPREAALLKAIGFDRLAPEQRELAMHISKRYELDPMLKHLVLIEGRAYITRDGLLHIAHRSGQLDGIEATEPAIIDGFWRASCSVYRKDMSRPFTYTGRYPTTGGNQKFAPEMAVKVAEVMALRRAFDVAAPTAEERWDVPEAAPEPSRSAAQPSLAERAAAKRAEVETATIDGGNGDAPETLFTEAEAPALRLTKPQFVANLSESGIDPNHAATLRLVMFPDASVELTDEQRGALWLQLEREKAEAEAVPA
jgi:hypothetical protein